MRYAVLNGSVAFQISVAGTENYTNYERVKNTDKIETYTTEQASQNAIEWCEKHPGWKRICDIENSDSLYKTWDELSDNVKKSWVDEYSKYSAESAWREFGKRPCKVPYGFITGKGEFYKDVLQVPLYHNLMMVFKVS